MTGNAEPREFGFEPETDPEPAPPETNGGRHIIPPPDGGRHAEIVGRLEAIERAYPTLQEAIAELQQAVRYLLSQRPPADLQMERHARATALDLAIKAVPAGTEAATLTTVAGAFLDWLKAPAAPEQSDDNGRA